MSNGGELFALGGDESTEPHFESALRGYDKRQVDRYVVRVEQEIGALASEREQAFGQIHALAAQVEQLQVTLAAARQSTAASVDEPARFRHLGPRVEQILALAEDQAEEIRSSATGDIQTQRDEAERILGEARAKAAAAIKDFELALAARRGDEDRADKQRRAEVDAELATVQAEARRIANESAERISKAQAETEAYVRQSRAQAQDELQRWRAGVEREIAQRQAAGEREYAARRAAAEQELAKWRAGVEQQVAAHRGDAERYAVELRRQAEEHATAVRRHLEEHSATAQQHLATTQQHLAATQQEAATARQQLAEILTEVAKAQQSLADFHQQTWRSRQESDRVQATLAAQGRQQSGQPSGGQRSGGQPSGSQPSGSQPSGAPTSAPPAPPHPVKATSPVRQADQPPATASGSAPVPGPGRTLEVDKADAPADAQPETEAADTPEASTPESPTPAGPQRSGGSAGADTPAPREQSARVGAD